MKSAPTTSGEYIRIKTKDGEVLEASYYDCQWLRESFDDDPGDPTVADCWEGPDGQIELEDAAGWLPLNS